MDEIPVKKPLEGDGTPPATVENPPTDKPGKVDERPRDGSSSTAEIPPTDKPLDSNLDGGDVLPGDKPIGHEAPVDL